MFPQKNGELHTIVTDYGSVRLRFEIREILSTKLRASAWCGVVLCGTALAALSGITAEGSSCVGPKQVVREALCR